MRIKLLTLTMVPLALAFAALVHGQSTGRADLSGKRGSKEAAVDYNRDILPILANNCFTCHGPAEQKAGLRLDQRDHAIKPTRSKATPIQPGKSAESELIRRILASDEAERMPPAKTKKTLRATERELLRKWIDQGAPYKAHWAFVPPNRPTPPAVKDKAWVKNEIDAFILAKLEQAGLKPAPRADKATLIRRLSLDLRGVPPSLAEIDEFLADSAPDAYAKLVDRMLASPRFGEKMALLWLDLARFGDTSGFENDSSRQMWKWRDWVIDAFNKNMPFDQFTIEQLAGDLLPNATTEQKIASGFNRNTRFNEENGSDPEEFVIRYNVDRTNTLGQVWLGLTLGCAQCHSHKYDPISQKEYYQLFAYFTGIKEPHKTGLHNVPLEPILTFPSPEQAKMLANLERDRAELQKGIDGHLAKVSYKDPLEGKETVKTASGPKDVIWFDDAPPPGAKLDGQWQWANEPVHHGKWSMVRAGAGFYQHSFTRATKPLYINAGDRIFVYVYLDPKNPPKAVTLQFYDGTWQLYARWADSPHRFLVGSLPPTGKWVRLEVDIDKLSLLPDTRVSGMSFSQVDGNAYYDQPGISSVFSADDSHLTSVSAWEPRAKVNGKQPIDLKAALKITHDKRSPEQKAKNLQH